jgi:hypothetical protein
MGIVFGFAFVVVVPFAIFCTLFEPTPIDMVPPAITYKAEVLGKLADNHLTERDAELLKKIILFMNLEKHYYRSLFGESEIFVTGNIHYPAIILDRFNFRDYFGDYDVYLQSSFSTRGDFAGHPFSYWYQKVFGDKVFYKCWHKKIDATFCPYLTYERDPVLFTAMKEWYMSWGPNPTTEFRELFARFFVPYGQDLNNPQAFLDAQFRYTYETPSFKINEFVDDHKYPRYRSTMYGDVNLIEAWPIKPEDHWLFIDLVRLSSKGLGEYNYPETREQFNLLRHTMQTFLQIYYKKFTQKENGEATVCIASIDSEGVRNPWGKSNPDFLTLSNLGLDKEVCWV